MPTQGSSIPVLSVEKFWIDNDGRGLNFHWDGTNFFSGAITTNAYASGTSHQQVLPAASTNGWLHITAMSGTTGKTFDGYLPVFKIKW